MTANYKLREGFFVKTSAENVGMHLENLADSLGGSLTPADVVDDATPSSSPIHPEFEWDDAVAANAHRKDTARHLLRCYVKVYTRPGDDRKEEKVIGFVSVANEEGGRSYRTMDVVSASPEMEADVLSDAVNRIEGLKQRLCLLRNSGKVIRALDEAVSHIQELSFKNK